MVTRPRGAPARPINPQRFSPSRPVPVAEPVQPVAAPVAMLPQTMDDGGVSPLMISSLPSMASGADVYSRQFYRAGSKIPQRRFFPVVYQ